MSNPSGPLNRGTRNQDSRASQEVHAMVASSDWLKENGLRRCKLSFSQILMQISFRQSEDYIDSLGKSVSSQYAEGLFPQFQQDGAVFNLTAPLCELQDVSRRLDGKVQLYRSRLHWLTTGSRRLFGVIQECVVAMVLIFGEEMTTTTQFNLCRHSLAKVIWEQIAQLDRFNLVCAGRCVMAWQEEAVVTSADNLRAATDWLLGLEQEVSAQGSAASAVLKAMEDHRVEGVYLFAAGDVSEDVTEALRSRLVGNVQPLHTVSFNARREASRRALRALSELAHGRSHVFAELRLCGEQTADSDESKLRCSDSLHVTRELIGGTPPGCEVRQDVYLVWREMEEALRTRDRIQGLMKLLPIPDASPDADLQCLCEPWACVSSRVWLRRFGLKAQGLTLHQALAGCIFPHADGVVDIRHRPQDEQLQTDAESRRRLVNAKYCSGFAHMLWRDGSVVHVNVTDDRRRQYEGRMRAALTAVQSRLDWLMSGSRELFGIVLEDQVYLLIDTSESMRELLPLVKDKTYQLIQEQLWYKTKINMVSFGTCVSLWRDRLTQVTTSSMESASQWIRDLQVGGSTNTMEALGKALAEQDTQAIYLLTDGLPVQSPSLILGQVRSWSPAPVHTISLNCDDQEANQFLFELSQMTGGRFHRFHTPSRESADTPESSTPEPFESEDLQLLRAELQEGERDLESFLKLHAECVLLDSYHQSHNLNRPHSAPVQQGGTSRLHGTPGTGSETRPELNIQLKPKRCTAHTKASLLRLLANSGPEALQSQQDWMLPETKELFQTNMEKKMHVLHSLGLSPSDKSLKKEKKRKPKEHLDVPTVQWLKTNSLVARQLTLKDALAPAAIPHKGRFVAMLGKHVYSRVFDEVMPLTHISSSRDGSPRLTLVNPLAVNLEKYKARLQEAIHIYERRLNEVVWRVLPQEGRDRCGGKEPLMFLEHREALLEVLGGLGWPVAQEELTLLEEEISTALSYIQQASDLQQAAQQAASNSKRTTESKMGNTPNNAQLKNSRKPTDPLRGQRVVARSEVNGYYYPGTVRKRLSGKRVMVDFSMGGSEVIPLQSVITVGGGCPCPPLGVGDCVLVSDGSGGRYVPGVVIATPCRLVPEAKLFSVLRHGSKKIHTVRSNIIKISQTRYINTCSTLPHPIHTHTEV